MRKLSWPHLRAALITIALLVHGIYALPLPREMKLEKIREEAGTENVDRWLGWFGSVGLHPDRVWFEETVCGVTRVTDRVHKAMKAPAKPWMTFAGNSQSWALFAILERWPIRLEIRIMREGSAEWETLYRRLDPVHDSWDDVLSYRRMRGIWDGQLTKPKSGYKNMTKWLARQIFAADPTISRLEVRGIRTHTTLPGESVDLDTKVFGSRPHRRENHMEGPKPAGQVNAVPR
ncbi:MAG: hypothetical protein H0V89_09705 [Deltaproteobacteria bacterium]|nr:hypothetical protein [Deltaproteobacteria bacterium]